MAFNLTVKSTEATLFPTNPPRDIVGPNGGNAQRNAPAPLYGVTFALANIAEADAMELSAEFAQTRAEEVIVTIVDRVPPMPSGTVLTVQSHTGSTLVITGWPSGRTVPAGKSISAQKDGRWYFVKTRGSTVGSGIVTVTVIGGRVTFAPGSAVSWEPKIQGFAQVPFVQHSIMGIYQGGGAVTVVEAR